MVISVTRVGPANNLKYSETSLPLMYVTKSHFASIVTMMDKERSPQSPQVKEEALATSWILPMIQRSSKRNDVMALGS
jgi:hypothetical protein